MGNENSNVLQCELLSHNWKSVTPVDGKSSCSPDIKAVPRRQKSLCKLPVISSQFSTMHNTFGCNTKKIIITKCRGLVKNQSMKMNTILFPPIEITDNPSFKNKRKNFIIYSKYRYIV